MLPLGEKQELSCCPLCLVAAGWMTLPQLSWGSAGTHRLTSITDEGKQVERKDQNYQFFNDKKGPGHADIWAHVRSFPKTHIHQPFKSWYSVLPKQEKYSATSPKFPQPFEVFPIVTSPSTYQQASFSPSNNLNTFAQDMFSNCPKFQTSLPALSTYFSHPQLPDHPRVSHLLSHCNSPAFPNQSVILHNPGLKIHSDFSPRIPAAAARLL